ncbi:hypothetical protein AAF712_005786 [Marasmius tenuissimus]|uniref:Glucose-methanol-choline oxidoreductase N-terminal domain-containing protein n=1 Tax=Marasmius tenuissimus TaxID=585030 RepID=A0ABR3A1I6_9AGAR
MKAAEKWSPPTNPNFVEVFGANNDSENHGTTGGLHTTPYANYSSLTPPWFSALGNLGIPYNKATSDTLGAMALPTRLSVSREVILSAGSLKNPQLLELSGIGNSSILEHLGIDPLVDLPGVGENLQDHPGVNENFQTLDDAITFDTLSNPVAANQQLEQYIHNRTGMYSAFSSSAAFIPWSMFMTKDEIAQLRSELDVALASDQRFNTSVFRLQRKWIEDDAVPELEVILFPRSALANPTDADGKFYTFNVLLMHSWSRGNVHIVDTNGLSAPRIDMAYLQSPADIDIKVFVKALRFGHTLSQTEPMRSLTSQVLGPFLNSTDEELVAWLKENLGTNYHFVGTAAMLPREEGGVVDSEFRVYGTQNLRVADASIFPIVRARSSDSPGVYD